MIDKLDALNGVVSSSRIRLARNLSGYLFPCKQSSISLSLEVINQVNDCLTTLNDFKTVILKDMSPTLSRKLLEKHLISKELLDNSVHSAYCINKEGNIVIMLNEEDHIREQCFLKGLNLRAAYEKLSEIDKLLCDSLPMAFSSQIGFLTSCPSNVGTGLRASVMMFLPALSITGAMDEVIKLVKSYDLTVRGVYGEGSEADGYMYQISNATSLGLTEEKIISNVEKMVYKLADMESSARDLLLQSKKDELKDQSLRAYGILSNAYSISSSEFISLLAKLKLGVYLGIVELKDEKIIDKIEEDCLPANLTELYGRELKSKERDRFRADYLSKILYNQRIKNFD